MNLRTDSIERIGERQPACEPLPDIETLLNPPFVPHRLIVGGHLQSVLSLRSKNLLPLQPNLHWVQLPDGDRLAMLDDKPASWRPGDASVVVVHGLCGCSESAYMLRFASRFTQQGVRVFRLNLRGCGIGIGHAKQITHAGRSDDLVAAIGNVASLTQNGPINVIGVSLGGNQLLRAFGRIGQAEIISPDKVPTWRSRIHRIAAVSPPIDLHRCSDSMGRRRMRPYNRYFIRHLLSTVSDELRSNELIQQALQEIPRTMRELDERVTAPLAGYSGAPDYYQSTAATQVMNQISVPTLVLAANDDPIVPVSCFGHTIRANWPDHIRLVITRGGGHVGFIGRGQHRHWMDGLLERWFGFSTIG